MCVVRKPSFASSLTSGDFVPSQSQAMRVRLVYGKVSGPFINGAKISGQIGLRENSRGLPTVAPVQVGAVNMLVCMRLGTLGNGGPEGLFVTGEWGWGDGEPEVLLSQYRPAPNHQGTQTSKT